MEDIETQLEDEFFSSILNLDSIPAADFPPAPQQPQPPAANNNLQAQIQQQQAQLHHLKQQKQHLQTQIQHMNIIQHQQPFPTYQNSFYPSTPQQPFIHEAAQQFATIGNNVFAKNAPMKQEDYAATVQSFAQESSFNNSFFPQQPVVAPRPYNNSPMQVVPNYSSSPHSPYWDGTTMNSTSPVPSIAPQPVHQQASLPFASTQQTFFAPAPTAPVFPQQPLYQPLPAFSQPVIQQNNVVLRLVEGYNRQLEADEKPIGGKDNVKHPLAKQVVELNASTVPKNVPVLSLCVKAFVCGYHKPSKSSTSATKVVLAEVGEKKFEEKKEEGNTRYMASFDNIICKFSSHNNGQKLFLRFVLCDGNKTRICYIDSEEFETITKRGIDKQKKRKRSDSDSAATVEDVDPACGFVSGGQLVKITGFGFMCPPVSQAIVQFGLKESPEIHSMKRNVIICETPSVEKPCVVDVTVSFDRKTYLQTNAKYRYIDSNDEQGMKEMLKYFMKSNSGTPVDHNSKMVPDSPEQNNVSNATAPNMPPVSSWLKGIEHDYRGYNLLHFSCAYGFVELSLLLMTSPFFDLNVLDNFGRSALFWAVWSDSAHIVKDLIACGASLAIQDINLDNFIHLAAKQNQAVLLKDVLFWLLANDSTIKSNTSTIKLLLHQKNEQGLTPLDIAKEWIEEEDDDYLYAVLNAVDKICNKQSISDIAIHEFVFRAGSNNGKKLSDVLPSVVSSSLKLDKDHYTLIMSLDDKKQLFTCLEHKNIAFIIIDHSKNSIEWTLKQSAEVIASTNILSNEIAALKSCLSFKTEASKASLQLVREFASQSMYLKESMPNFFTFAEKENSKAAVHTSSIDSKSKHILARKMFETRFQQVGFVKTQQENPLLVDNKNVV